MSRLDYFLISNNISPWTEDAYLLPGFRSDHSQVGIIINPCNTERGRGVWKFNTKLLDNTEFIEKINMVIDDGITTSGHLNPSDLWEYIKMDIVKFSTDFAIKLAKEKRKRLND